MHVLVLNCGSSSLKFDVMTMTDSGVPSGLAAGAVEHLGEHARAVLSDGAHAIRREDRIPDHRRAFAVAMELLAESGAVLAGDFTAVGHRVVHGGARFREPVRIDDHVRAEIEEATRLAPLHNRPALDVIATAGAHFGPDVPMVATFDTAFFAALPAVASTYAIPRELSERFGVRRFGFHGLAHRSMVESFRAERPGVVEPRLITLQLGSGCSIAASRDGQPLDTSMGFTPLEGLVMGTRSGDLDPALPLFLAKQLDLAADEVDTLLNTESGLLGLSGLSHDMESLLAAADGGHAGARLAVDVFCYRARKYVGAYLAALGGADAIVFGGGVGEHSAEIRERICAGFEWAGLRLDARANRAADGATARLSADDSGIEAWVVPVDEASLIARDVFTVLGATRHAP